MTAALWDPVTLSEDLLRVLGSRAGVHQFPAVLAMTSRHATIAAREAALGRATREAESANLIIDGTVAPHLVPMLQALKRPDRELAMRLVTPDGTARVSLVRREHRCFLARRVDEQITVRILAEGSELRHATTALLTELPRSGPADVASVGAPLQQMSQTLSDTHDARTLADRIRALGADPAAAMLLGTALASRQAFAEIVYYAFAAEEGRITRGRAAVAALYTKRGRIIAAPSASPAGEVWTTLKAGSDHAFGQAIGHLVELSDDRWETNGVNAA